MIDWEAGTCSSSGPACPRLPLREMLPARAAQPPPPLVRPSSFSALEHTAGGPRRVHYDA